MSVVGVCGCVRVVVLGFSPLEGIFWCIVNEVAMNDAGFGVGR